MRKIDEKSIQKRMFSWTCFLDGSGLRFGRVLGGFWEGIGVSWPLLGSFFEHLFVYLGSMSAQEGPRAAQEVP